MKPYNIENKTKSEEVNEMFNNIAPTYDRLNHILSLSIDKVWRRNVVRIVRALKPSMILDLATGTGDMAIALAKDNPSAKVVAIDPSQGMLAVAQRKIEAQALDMQIELQCGAAESLETRDGQFDVATVAFGVRNFGDLKGGMTQITRSLAEGGSLVVLEFAVCENWFVAPLYRLYSRYIMPFIGALLSRDKKAYTYLPESIEEFERPAQFLKIMEECGLKNCYNRPQFWGVAQIYVGEKK